MFAAIRAAVGDNADVATDFHGRSTPMISKILCRGLEPYFPMFVEEALHGQDGAEGAAAWRELLDSTTGLPASAASLVPTTAADD